MTKSARYLILVFSVVLHSPYLKADDQALRLFQAVKDYYEDIHSWMSGGSGVSQEVRERYKRDILLFQEIVRFNKAGDYHLSRQFLSELIEIGNRPYRYTSLAGRKFNDLSSYTRSSAGHYDQYIHKEMQKFVREYVTEASQVESLMILAFMFPNDVQMTELILSSASNPDLFLKVNLNPNSEIKNFLRLMLSHPSSHARSWAAMGLAYFVNDTEVRQELIKINSQERAELLFGKAAHSELERQITLLRSKTVFLDESQTERWLAAYSDVYQKWVVDRFTSKIDDYYDYDREFSVIKSAGLALLWEAIPNKNNNHQRIVSGRLGLPDMNVTSYEEAKNFKIENPPHEKVYVELKNAWVIADMDEAQIREARQSIEKGISIKTPFGNRRSILSYLKYRILGLEMDLYKSEKVFVNLASRLFGIRSLIIFGEKSLAVSEIEKIMSEGRVVNITEEWQQVIRQAYGPAEGARKIMRWMNFKTANSCRVYFAK